MPANGASFVFKATKNSKDTKTANHDDGVLEFSVFIVA
jgi:hypothetical protein